MKVTMRRTPRGEYESNVEIRITDPEGRSVGRLSAGNMSECPEDANLGRDLSFVYDIPSWLKAAYDAGAAGETFELDEAEVAEI